MKVGRRRVTHVGNQKLFAVVKAGDASLTLGHEMVVVDVVAKEQFLCNGKEQAREGRNAALGSRPSLPPTAIPQRGRTPNTARLFQQVVFTPYGQHVSE